MSRFGAWLVFGLALFGPRLAAACAVCAPEDDESRRVFMITTAFLTFLPLGMLGGLIYWFRRRYLELQREQADAWWLEIPPPTDAPKS